MEYCSNWSRYSERLESGTAIEVDLLFDASLNVVELEISFTSRQQAIGLTMLQRRSVGSLSIELRARILPRPESLALCVVFGWFSEHARNIPCGFQYYLSVG